MKSGFYNDCFRQSYYFDIYLRRRHEYLLAASSSVTGVTPGGGCGTHLGLRSLATHKAQEAGPWTTHSQKAWA
ncbi:hypothetical protein KSZ_50390 [Dictyobacter formicarum]|uniref:Uncharacterized protein n=1 Tax=Dictyobacter formicarum TaxID=2778368 RepID=A0ABQ3VNT1_9CHLR|nr:hypothetical protein KSZ_50390 [Dictyobacter formicarum]